MATTQHKLFPLHCGVCTLGENHVLGDAFSDDDRITFVCYAFLVITPDKQYILVDLGPVGLDYLNSMFRRFAFFRELAGDPDAIRQPYGNVLDHLDRLGIRPEQIDHVILTHMHADHHGLTDGTDAGAILQMPNAVLHVSGIGWQHNLDSRDKNGNWATYVDYKLSDYLVDAIKTGRAIAHDNYTLIDGVDVFYLGGHSICSQAIAVQTACGPAVIAGDDMYHYDLLARGILARLHTTPDNLIASTERLIERATTDDGFVLPCHDPLLAEWYQTYGDEWIGYAKAKSKESISAFRRGGSFNVLGAKSGIHE